MPKQPKRIKAVDDLLPDRRNANKHTERGSRMMEDSMRECGFGDSLTVDRNGVVISGNQRLETLADIGLHDPIVVQSDGSRPIIHQRTDLDATSERARKLAVMSNRVGEVNLDWDADVLASLREDIDLGKAFSEAELNRILKMPVIQPERTESGIQMQVTCPHCGQTFAPKETPGQITHKAAS